MIPFIRKLFIIAVSLTSFTAVAQKRKNFKPKELFKSDNLIIKQVAPNSFIHTSFKQTNDFGYVPCNGLIVRDGGEVVIFDTPTNDSSSAELISWIKERLHGRINAVVPTHFHDDCLGGLQAFNKNNIPSYANERTIALAKQHKLPMPKNGFNDSLILAVGKTNVTLRFFGEGHTKDNVVGYFPKDHILFGGCLIKENGASKGYLGDANTNAWSTTVEKIKLAYPDLKLVVPGHGLHGDKTLLDYTIRLFSDK